VFLVNDSISEVVAHFIGYFEIRVEEMRLRHAYDDFIHDETRPDSPDLPYVPTRFTENLELTEFLPRVTYVPPVELIAGDAQPSLLQVARVHIDLPQPLWFSAVKPELPVFRAGLQSEATSGAPHGPDPASSIAVINQIRLLADNDVVVLGDLDLAVERYLGDSVRFDGLVADAARISAPLADLNMPTTVEQIPEFIEAAAQVIQTMADMPETDGTTVLTGSGGGGIHVNGAAAAEAPDLAEFLPTHGEETPKPQPQTSSVGSLTINPDEMTTTIAVESGANVSTNEAMVVNAGLTSTFFAVVGDYHEINSIVQTNVYSDADQVDSGFPGVSTNDAGMSASFNVASIAHEVRDGAADAAAANPGILPQNWQVSVVEGDMVFFGWIVQYGFTSDGDTHVLSSTGTTTTITTGENLGLDHVDFANLGLYYDLVIIGGNLYDANFITQTNVLYDDDVLSMLSDSPDATGNVSTSGNLLWNSATISNIGATDWQSGLPESYNEAIDAVQSPGQAMPDSLKADNAFEGFYGLKVLYVTGDVYDLQYVEQVNVMGDADSVAIYEQGLLEASSGTHWDVSTGSNALVNTAAIIDYDTLGDTAYLDGQIYSDAILIQAEIVGPQDNPAAAPGDALANEVIAFIDEDIGPVPTGDDAGPVYVSGDGPPVDVMQSVLA
jgi:hypothetical protein